MKRPSLNCENWIRVHAQKKQPKRESSSSLGFTWLDKPLNPQRFTCHVDAVKNHKTFANDSIPSHLSSPIKIKFFCGNPIHHFMPQCFSTRLIINPTKLNKIDIQSHQLWQGQLSIPQTHVDMKFAFIILFSLFSIEPKKQNKNKITEKNSDNMNNSQPKKVPNPIPPMPDSPGSNLKLS